METGSGNIAMIYASYECISIPFFNLYIGKLFFKKSDVFLKSRRVTTKHAYLF